MGVINRAAGRIQPSMALVIAVCLSFMASLVVFTSAYGTTFDRAARIVELHILAAGLFSLVFLWRQNWSRDRNDRSLRLIEQFHRAATHPGADLVDRKVRSGVACGSIEQCFPKLDEAAQVRSYLDLLELFALGVLLSEIDEGQARAVAWSRVSRAWFLAQASAKNIRATMGPGAPIWDNLERLADRWTSKAINQNMGSVATHRLYEQPLVPKIPE